MSNVDYPASVGTPLVESGQGIISDEADSTYRLPYDPSIDDTSLAVVGLVAAITETDPVELDPLHDTIDACALNQVVSGTREDCSVQFDYEGVRIIVEGSGVVTCDCSNGAENDK